MADGVGARPGKGQPHHIARPLQRARVNFTAELLTSIELDVEDGDDWRHAAYNAAIQAVSHLLEAGLSGHATWSWDVQADDVHAIAAQPEVLPEPGALLTHRLPDGGRLELSHGQARILDPTGEEVACWVDTEWKEDPAAITATLNAVSLALAHGAEAVRQRMSH